MSKLKILIIDDDPTWVLDLKKWIVELGYEVADTLKEHKEISPERIESANADVILINLKYNGPTHSPDYFYQFSNKRTTAVILLADAIDSEVYKQVKNLPYHGLLFKPFNKLKLDSSIRLAHRMCEKTRQHQPFAIKGNGQSGQKPFLSENMVFIKKNNKLERVTVNQIESIQSEGNYCLVSTANKKFALKMSLVKIKQMLSEYPFVRINKRCIINVNLISSIDLSTSQVTFNGEPMPVGRAYKERLLKSIKILA